MATNDDTAGAEHGELITLGEQLDLLVDDLDDYAALLGSYFASRLRSGLKSGAYEVWDQVLVSYNLLVAAGTRHSPVPDCESEEGGGDDGE